MTHGYSREYDLLHFCTVSLSRMCAQGEKEIKVSSNPSEPSEQTQKCSLKTVRETSGTVRRVGKSGRIAWIEPCDPIPEGKLPLKKRPLELDSKSAGRMCDECFLFTLEKQRKKRKKIGKEIRRKPNQAVFTSYSSGRI